MVLDYYEKTPFSYSPFSLPVFVWMFFFSVWVYVSHALPLTPAPFLSISFFSIFPALSLFPAPSSVPLSSSSSLSKAVPQIIHHSYDDFHSCCLLVFLCYFSLVFFTGWFILFGWLYIICTYKISQQPSLRIGTKVLNLLRIPWLSLYLPLPSLHPPHTHFPAPSGRWGSIFVYIVIWN